VARAELLTGNPDVRKALSELSGKISDDTMRAMNYAVDAEHRQVRDVAKKFLAKIVE
jgi:glycine betaine/choline ABC-type transport system substrate-binding protein